MAIAIIFLLLLQVFSALSQYCITSNGGYGFCAPMSYCNTHAQQSDLSQCMPGIYCCPFTYSGQVTTEREPKFPTDCGSTPIYPNQFIVGGISIKPDEFSWLASLQYGYGNSYGVCGGSVINSRYVLTAAHCVTGSVNQQRGFVTGVRLGDFNQREPCDYGKPHCAYYQHFAVEETVWHPNYNSYESASHSDIALLRLDRSIQFGTKMKPICLPFGANNISEPETNTMLIASGWGNTFNGVYNPAKRAVSVPLWSKETCNQPPRDESQVCAGTIGQGVCHGDSGGPLMFQFETNRMVLEGITSYGSGPCSSQDVYTSVRYYEDWITNTMRM